MNRGLDTLTGKPLRDEVPTGKPSWEDAPEGAKWLAQCSDGSWWFYFEQPTMCNETRSWVALTENAEDQGAVNAGSGLHTGLWRNSLQSRPTEKAHDEPQVETQNETKTSDSTTKTESEKTTDDPINHPTHYTAGTIECIDAIRAAMTDEEFRGYCKGNILKYTWRERHKGENESLQKAQWYLQKLIEAMGQ